MERDESVEIRYVNGSFVAGTSASSPGAPRHIHIYLYIKADTEGKGVNVLIREHIPSYWWQLVL